MGCARIVRLDGRRPRAELYEAIRKKLGSWRFRPARKNGKPVAVIAIVHVSFHLL